MEFLITVLIIWFGWKLLRWWVMRSFRKRANNIFEQFTRQSGRQWPNGSDEQSTPRRSKTGWDRPATKKKIAREEGEYIEWEEVSITESTTQTVDAESTNYSETTEYSKTTERIVDAEWEDL